MTSKYLLRISLIAFWLIFLAGCAGLSQQKARTVAESQASTLIAYAKTLPTSTATPLPVEMIDTRGVTMRLVPAGEFMMGSNDGNDDEKPIHRVTLADFYMDIYEVTNAAYKLCVNAGMCFPPAKSDFVETRSTYYNGPDFDDHPVTHVDWNMAKSYCAWRDARLPTEAEWEKAARGTEGLIYPWGNLFDGALANTCDVNCSEEWANSDIDDGFANTAPVGTYPEGVSPYGMYDMAGNADEWVKDWYAEAYYQSSPSSNPPGPGTGEYRVVRGSSWSWSDFDVRTANRFWEYPTAPLFGIGFRCTRGTAP